MQRLKPLQNYQFGSKNKIAKNISETNLKAHYNYSVKKKHFKRKPSIPEIRPF